MSIKEHRFCRICKSFLTGDSVFVDPSKEKVMRDFFTTSEPTCDDCQERIDDRRIVFIEGIPKKNPRTKKGKIASGDLTLTDKHVWIEEKTAEKIFKQPLNLVNILSSKSMETLFKMTNS